MRNRCTLLFVTLGALLFCAPAFGQGSPTVFVTDGTNGTIRAFDTGTSLFSTVHTFSEARLEGLTYGPDGKLYACDPTNGNIYRVKPDGTDPEQVLVFEDVAPTRPQCGRFSSAGDFYVVDEAGTGVWMFTAASLAGTLPATPTKVLGTTELGSTFGGSGDITQANRGDLLVDDRNDGEVFVVPYPFPPFPSSALTPLISELDDPTGITRSSTGDIFISEQGSSNKIVRYTSTGTLVGDCGIFGTTTGGPYTPDIPFFIKFSADDTLYVATSQPIPDPSVRNGKLWKEDISTCGSPSFLTDMPVNDDSDFNFAAIGVALPPTSTTPVTKAISTPAGRNFNFNFSSFEISQTTPASCSATVQAIQTLLSTLAAGFTPPAGASFVPYLGEAGIGTRYSVNPTTCTNGEALVGAFTASFLNPRIVKCDPNLTAEGHVCSVLDPNAIYPLGGPIPGDGSLGGSAGGFSDFFVIDEGLSTDPSVKGNFCGFNPPLTNTTDPASAPVFSLSTTGTIPVKFLLGKTANCKSFITDATALLSVAEVDAGFAPIFPLTFNGQGGNSPIFGLTGKQYHLNLNVTGYVAPGTYSVCVTFLTGNAAPECTYFKLVP